MSPGWRTPLALAVLLALTAGFYWRITLGHERTFLGASDLTNVVRPWLDYEAREFHAGRFPLWTPYEWGGHTLIGQVQPGVVNPLNWILFAMPLQGGHIPISTLHWYWVMIHWLGAVFAYALCRDLNCGQIASLAGGSIFALAGFMGHTDWPQILMSSIWVPVVLLFFARVVRGERPLGSAALCGAALGMAFLSGHHVVPTFTAVLVGALWVVHIAGDWRRAKLLAVFAGILFLVSAVQVLPAVEYAKQAVRWADAPEPLHWGEVVPYNVHARYSLGWKSVWGMVAPGISLHANPHVGAVAMALAIAAIVLGWRERKVRWFAGVALGGLLLALGADFPPYWLIYRFIPMVEKAREPAMAIVLSQTGIAALAAFCVSRLRKPWAGVAALALLVGEAVYDAPRFGSYEPLETVRRQEDIAAFLKSQPGWFRVDFDDRDVAYNFGDFYGIEQFGGALSSMPERTQVLLGHEETPRLFGIRYYVGRAPRNPAQQEVFLSRSGLKVYRDPRIGEPLSVIREASCGSVDRLASLSRAPNAPVVEAEMACPGLLMVGDAYYPGWRAWVDGRRVPVQEVYAVRGVRLDAGRHRVEFVYRPAPVYWGFGCTLLGVSLVTVLCLLESRAGTDARSGRRVIALSFF